VSRWHARPLSWIADVEDDVGHPDVLPVFVPSIMGVGILASLAILVVDGVRAMDPRRTTARRRISVRRQAVELVGPVAAAAGVRLPPPPAVRRRLRSRRGYVAVFVVSTAMALYVAIGSTANYLRPGGYLEGVVWVQAIASVASALFLAVGLVALVLAARHPAAPRWARNIVDHSPLGALDT
jgi:hypothetical protein